MNKICRTQARFNKSNDKINFTYGEKDAMIMLTFEKNNVDCILSNITKTDIDRAIFILVNHRKGLSV